MTSEESWDEDYEKVCSRCKEEKPFIHFHNCANSKDGKQAYCKDCRKEENQKHYQNNPQYQNNYLKTHEKQNLMNKLAARLNVEYRKQGVPKSKRITARKLLGIPVELFQEWLNYTKMIYVEPTYDGPLDIDHVISFSMYNLHDEYQLRRVCHWTNIRLLKSHDNRVKSCKLPTNDELMLFCYIVNHFNETHILKNVKQAEP